MFFSLNRKQIKRAMILVAGNEGAFKDEHPAYIALPTIDEYAAGLREARILSERGNVLGTIPSIEAFKL
jgi:hypothetical protein